MSDVITTVLGAVVIVTACSAGWWVGGAVARRCGMAPPNLGDRGLGCIVAFLVTFGVMLFIAVSHVIGAVILDVLR